MAKKNAVRTLIKLVCSCEKSYTYHSEKNRVNTSDRLHLRKYCPPCRKHVEFTESRR